MSQADSKTNERDRVNYEWREGELYVCKGEHDKALGCDFKHYVPAQSHVINPDADRDIAGDEYFKVNRYEEGGRGAFNAGWDARDEEVQRLASYEHESETVKEVKAENKRLRELLVKADDIIGYWDEFQDTSKMTTHLDEVRRAAAYLKDTRQQSANAQKEEI